jgi:hypothetical protein
MIDRIATMDETIARLSSHQGRARVGAAKAESVGVDLAAGVDATAVVTVDMDADRARRLRIL